ncbi:MAG: hypothetical protein E7333_07875 [Clostridiales bacterium]|nr:hypothetical protein [Clostridiales bacterium]
MRMWNQFAGRKPHHRFDGRILILGLLALLMMFSVAAAEEEAPATLMGVVHPDYAPGAVEPHEPTGNEYFADAVFIGDSLMEHLEMTEVFPDANYVWKVGMGPISMGNKQFRLRGVDGKLSAYEAVAHYQPKKIFILLGGNGLNTNLSDVMIGHYEAMVDQLITLCPDAMIFALAPAPGSKKGMEDRGIAPARFAQFCTKLEELSQRKGLYFLDLYHLLADEDGNLPGEYDCGDGYHLSDPAYDLMVDLIRTHTVPYPEAE